MAVNAQALAEMKRVDGLGVVLAALFAAVLAGWIVNTLAPHLAWVYLLHR